jgi:hypothetical protein
VVRQSGKGTGARGRKNRAAMGGGTLLKGAVGRQQGGSGEVDRRVEGLEEGGPGSHRWGQPGRRGTATARAGGARVRTVADGAGSLTSGARMAAGGCGGERRGARVGRPGKGMEWAEPV